MKPHKKWIVPVAILLLVNFSLYFFISRKDQDIREIERLTGLILPSDSRLKFEEDNLENHAFYVLQFPNMVDFISENHLSMESYRNPGYLERYVRDSTLLPSLGDSLLTFSSHGSGNKWSAIVGPDSKLMWLSLHFMDWSGDVP